MKVIVCGAGLVGTTIARQLATEGNEVTVIDLSAERTHKVAESYDLRGIVGHASHPDVLEQAGAADSDMLIAVTFADEVNMVACEVAHALFNVPTKRSEEHTSELQSLMRISYAVFCLKK